MNVQDQRLENNRIVATMLCKVCFGSLVQKRIDDQDVVVCASDPTHEDFMAQAYAIVIDRQQRLDAVEVLQNYPELNPDPFQETSQESIDELYSLLHIHFINEV